MRTCLAALAALAMLLGLLASAPAADAGALTTTTVTWQHSYPHKCWTCHQLIVTKPVTLRDGQRFSISAYCHDAPKTSIANEYEHLWVFDISDGAYIYKRIWNNSPGAHHGWFLYHGRKIQLQIIEESLACSNTEKIFWLR